MRKQCLPTVYKVDNPKKYYWMDGNIERGPESEEALAQFIVTRLDPDIKVRCEGTSRWFLLRNLPEIKLEIEEEKLWERRQKLAMILRPDHISCDEDLPIKNFSKSIENAQENRIEQGHIFLNEYVQDSNSAPINISIGVSVEKDGYFSHENQCINGGDLWAYSNTIVPIEQKQNFSNTSTNDASPVQDNSTNFDKKLAVKAPSDHLINGAVFLGVQLSILIFGIIQICAAFSGSIFWGFLTLVIALWFRITLPLTIATFYGACYAWDWPWPFALILTAPGLIFVSSGFIARYFK